MKGRFEIGQKLLRLLGVVSDGFRILFTIVPKTFVIPLLDSQQLIVMSRFSWSQSINIEDHMLTIHFSVYAKSSFTGIPGDGLWIWADEAQE